MKLQETDIAILQEAEIKLRQLSSERLRVAAEFIAYLQDREENTATQKFKELLSMSKKRLRITPPLTGSGYSDTSINHDRVLAEPSQE
jgi:hypothetical protein